MGGEQWQFEDAFLTRFDRPRSKSPERRLQLAVLLEALDTLRARLPRRSPQHDRWGPMRARAEAARWVLAAPTRSPFAFANICEAFDVDVVAAREALERECDLVGLAAWHPPRRGRQRQARRAG